MNKSKGFMSQKLVKVFRLFKYLTLGTILIAFAFLRGIIGWHSDKMSNNRKLSKDDLQKLFPYISKVNADVVGDGDGGDDSGDGDGDGGC
jgi:hypothetical protein